MVSLPPGPVYLARAAFKVSVPTVSILLLQHYIPDLLPDYAWKWSCLLNLPGIGVIRRIAKYVREEREIRQLGARRMPLAPSTIPFGLDILYQISTTFINGYLSEGPQRFIDAVGPVFMMRILGRDTIFTVEPEHTKAILATDFNNFEKGAPFRSYMDSVLGVGVFNSDGDMWKFHRSITRPYFSKDRISHFETFDRHAEALFKKMKRRLAEGEAVDFQDLVGRFTLDSATEFLFGSCVNSLDADLPYAWNSPRNAKAPRTTHSSDKFAEAFSKAQFQIALRSRTADVYQLLEFWKDKTEDPMKDIMEFINPIVQEGLAKKKSMQLTTTEEKEYLTLLDDLFQKTDDVKILKDEVLNILIAGRDTTMCTLTFAVYCLSQNPEVLATLREEILTKIGPTRRPHFDDIKDLKYLRAVINETLRLYPPVPFNVRRSKVATALPARDGGKPYYVPSDVDVPYSPFIMHRRKDLWGPDAWEFDPNRFLDERLHKYLTPNPFIFMPFNAGPRICLGQQFAYNESSFLLIRLLQTFDNITLDLNAQPPASRAPESWKLAEGTQSQEKIIAKCHLTLYSHMGLWVKMHEAQHTDTV
ncbi:hypothetical protein M422DRAFT_783590 [Sphaerobolus stellatus SS14]|uniref:Unplaced genomic scaffold SPHSTscaffold_157, whole genome shotgun sequence n=1 Tax=Sphaerobolus stellatus (strain SS14) TaxID=990650 RepID=A0A0C9V3M7_SPHS4|nr:hypothetical protein M422DRAFT_783590 [Sphaerobolus stellatus SS14]